MHVSLNEFEGALTKAVKGVGLPFGIGEEAARAVRQAAVADLDCLGAFVAALDALDGGHAGAYEPGEAMNGALRPRAGAVLSSLLAGPAACDILSTRAATGQTEPRVDLSKVDVPLVVLAETLALAAERNADLLIGWHTKDGEPVTASFPAERGIGKSGKTAASLPQGPLDLWIGLQLSDDASVSRKPPGVTRGLAVEAAIWRRLLAYADRMLVENTEASRHTGAGAGIVDRD